MATRTQQRSPARHVADSHDLIRVQGARVNNLKDVSVELPKRRLTVFTGVSGSGKSSLVFDTIAAESQRLINETYSAFVQGFVPTLARTDDERRAIVEMMAKGTYAIILLATTDLDGTFERLRAGDAEVVQEPTDQPYGIRDCAFRDPSGNLIRIQELR